jgi:hypothetical protein
MKVLNVHERELSVPPKQVGGLIDSLSSSQDLLWPRHSWPRMEFDRPLQVGANGGHSPICYFVESYTPGRSIRFRFTGPKGFNGHHRFEIFEIAAEACILRHTLEMDAIGPAVMSWPLVFRPLHNALIEDSLALAQASLGQPPVVREWSSWVKLLRWLVSKGQARAQVTPNTAVNRDTPQAARPLP